MFIRNSGGYKPYNVAPTAVAPIGMAAPYCPPAKVSPAQFYPTQVSPAALGPAPFAPAQFAPAHVAPTQVAPTQVAPTQVSPTQEFVQQNVMNTVVPHVHPSHTTTVNKHVFTHQHYFPHTASVVNECFNQQVVCGPRPMINPCCPPRPFGF